MKAFKKRIITLAAFVIVACLAFVGCSPGNTNRPISANNLMDGIAPLSVSGLESSSNFVNSNANFSLDLFRESFDGSDNTLISPTSVLLALAMTANGARGNTLAQMEQVLGGSINMATLNRYLYSFSNSLPSVNRSQLEISNSLWFRQDAFVPNMNFLQTNANYFGADAYSAPFNQETVTDINNWVYNATDGMIESILEDIPGDAVMYLINAIMFDAEWARIFETHEVRDGQFTNHNGQSQATEFMTSGEATRTFVEGSGVKGFVKPYHGNHYSFVALLPDEDVGIESFVSSLTGQKFIDIMASQRQTGIWASMPKFEFDFSLSMNNILKEMGMSDAFVAGLADLTGIGEAGGNLFISNVQHETFIQVNERGTRAGAVTSVEVGVDSAPEFEHTIILDRPFVFAIVDNATNLPIFIGSLLSI